MFEATLSNRNWIRMPTLKLKLGVIGLWRNPIAHHSEGRRGVGLSRKKTRCEEAVSCKLYPALCRFHSVR